MTYRVRYMGNAHVVVLQGRFAAPDKGVVRELFDIFRQNKDGDRCVLAMEGLETLDFYGLEMLVLLSEMAQAQGVRLVIRRPHGQVKEMLGHTGLDKIIPIET